MHLLTRSFKEGDTVVLRIVGGDFYEALQQFLEENDIKMGKITFIGSFKKVTVGYYDDKTQQYVGIEFTEGPYEVISGMGNISIKDGKPFPHIHVALGDHKGQMFGGHLISAEVLLVEMFIEILEGTPLERKYDQETGLSIWQ